MKKYSDHFRLKKPCSNCPFLVKDAIELAPGRLEGIIKGILDDDMSTFLCHKTVHSASGGDWDDDSNYTPSGEESMCAGAAAYLMKAGRPTVAMRIAFAFGNVSVNDWDRSMDQIIEPRDTNEQELSQ